MNGAQLIETLQRATSPLVELEMPASSIALFMTLCEETGITYRVPDVRVIVPREKLLMVLMRSGRVPARQDDETEVSA